MVLSGSGIDKLRDLANRLPQLPVAIMSGNRVDVNVTAGSAVGINLLSSPHVSVLTWTMTPGTSFQPHSHTEREWIVVVSGKMRIKVADIPDQARLIVDDSGWFVLSAGDYVLISPDVIHEAYFDIYTELVTVHVPRSSDYSPFLQRSSDISPCQAATKTALVTGGSTEGSSSRN